MTDTEVVQLFLIFALLAISYWWFWTWGDREQLNALAYKESAAYEVAQTGSMFVPSFDSYVTKDATIFLPVCDGLYSQRIKPKKRSAYLSGLRRWLERGATIHVFVTMPEEEGFLVDERISEWRHLIDDFPTRLQVHLLYREQVSGPLAETLKAQIERLDTFHPVILVDDSGTSHSPGVMWIEGNHPKRSKYAYNVTFSDPADTATDPRFQNYKDMYKGLLIGSHVKTLEASSSEKLAA